MPSKQPDIIHNEPGAKMPRHKAEYSDMCDICGPRIKAAKERNDRVRRLQRSLVEFGYPLDNNEGLQTVYEAYDIAMSRKVTAEDGIIAMMVRSQLEEAGIISSARAGQGT